VANATVSRDRKELHQQTHLLKLSINNLAAGKGHRRPRWHANAKAVIAFAAAVQQSRRVNLRARAPRARPRFGIRLPAAVQQNRRVNLNQPIASCILGSWVMLSSSSRSRSPDAGFGRLDDHAMSGVDLGKPAVIRNRSLPP
jgi:hypothetical protein